MTELIYGLQPIREALRAGTPIRVIHMERASGHATDRLLEEAAAARVPVERTTRAKIDAKCGAVTHQGVVAEIAPRPDASLESVLDRAHAAGVAPLVLVLDQIQDPQNLGALIRSAYAFGVHGVVIPERRAASMSATVMKASAGAAAHMPIVTVPNIKRALERLKAEGLWVAAATIDGAALQEAALEGPLALVLGAEGKGIRETVRRVADFEVRIDLATEFNSLNVSAAGAILLHAIAASRKTNG